MAKVLTREDLEGLACSCAKRVSQEKSISDRIMRGAMNRMSALARSLFG